MKNKILNHRLFSLFFIAAICILSVLFMRYVLPLVLPFVLAFITSALIEPAILFLLKKTSLKRGLISVLCVLFSLGIIITIISLISGRVTVELISFTKGLPSLFSNITGVLTNWKTSVTNYIHNIPPELRNFFLDSLDKLISDASGIPAKLMGKLLSCFSAIAGKMPGIFLFVLTYTIGVFFISAGYPEIRAFIARQIPSNFRQKLTSLKNDMFILFGKWLKAELILMSITFLELLIMMLILRQDYALFLALLISVIDMLPLLGIGAALVPWSLFELISGSNIRALFIILSYCVMTIIRSFLEPKLVGTQIGLPPVVTLLSIYAGLRCAGVAGMILFPALLILLKNLNDRGWITLWKTKEMCRQYEY